MPACSPFRRTAREPEDQQDGSEDQEAAGDN